MQHVLAVLSLPAAAHHGQGLSEGSHRTSGELAESLVGVKACLALACWL